MFIFESLTPGSKFVSPDDKVCVLKQMTGFFVTQDLGSDKFRLWAAYSGRKDGQLLVTCLEQIESIAQANELVEQLMCDKEARESTADSLQARMDKIASGAMKAPKGGVH